LSFHYFVIMFIASSLPIIDFTFPRKKGVACASKVNRAPLFANNLNSLFICKKII